MELERWWFGITEPMTCLKRKKDNISFLLKGTKLMGHFSLVRLKGKEKEWLLIMQKDEYALSGWKLKTNLTPEKRAELKKRVPLCQTS